MRASRGAGVLLVEGGDLGQVGVENSLANTVLGADVILAVAGLELGEGRGLRDRDGGDAHSDGGQEEDEFHG